MTTSADPTGPVSLALDDLLTRLPPRADGSTPATRTTSRSSRGCWRYWQRRIARYGADVGEPDLSALRVPVARAPVRGG